MSMTESQRRSAVSRKRAKAQGVGGKPTNVRTFAKRKKSADRKSTRLNSSHGYISYAVFCLKKKTKTKKKKKKVVRTMPVKKNIINLTATHDNCDREIASTILLEISYHPYHSLFYLSLTPTDVT